MNMVVAAETPPLSADATGVFRVGHSRVTLGTVVGAFRDGATAEEIAEQYPAVSLGQVYAVIAYYLAHTAVVDDYLREREQRAADCTRTGGARWEHPSPSPRPPSTASSTTVARYPLAAAGLRRSGSSSGLVQCAGAQRATLASASEGAQTPA